MGEPSDDFSTDRIHSWAKAHASTGSVALQEARRPPTTPDRNDFAVHDGASISTRSTASPSRPSSQPHHNRSYHAPLQSRNGTADNISKVNPPAAPPPGAAKTEGEAASTLEEDVVPKPSSLHRVSSAVVRGFSHAKQALLYSKINILLVFVPIGIAVNFAGLDPKIIFAMNAIAVVPLAALLSYATESAASRLGDTVGALLNVTFGNAVELIIFINALVKNEIRIVQASLIGSILSNLLLILGMAFLLGGLRYREQIYNSTITQMSACLLSLSVMSLLLPTAFHAAFAKVREADHETLKVSRGTSVVLLFVYGLYLLFQLKSHAHMYQSTPQSKIDEELHPGVLANIMDSSSSSSSDSDSSSSSSDASSGSHTTAKRFRKAFRNRRRRKSSASSKEASAPSVVSSPSYDGTQLPTVNSAQPPTENAHPQSKRRRGSVLHAITSGDEADTDGEHNTVRRQRQIRAHDAIVEKVDLQDGTWKKKHKRKHSRRYHKHRSQPETGADFEKNDNITRNGTTDNIGSVHVDFAEPPDTGNEDASEPKRRNRPSLLSSKSSFRPPLPSLLSNNVFVTPATAAPVVPFQDSGVANDDHGLRRARSLPGRLNDRATPNASASRPAISPYNNRPRSSPAVGNEDDEKTGKPHLSRTAAVVMLLATTALVALCAEFLVDSIPAMVETSSVSQAFIGLIILPVVGNAAEHVTAVTVATKNKMDLAIGVAVGSSIQIALFVTPLIVILGWIMDREMTLYFNIFETISLFVTAFVVNFLVLDGRSNYLEGALLCASYVIIATAAFFYPDADAQSQIGGSENMLV